MEKISKFLNQWGYYILALLCIGTILLSAAWTNGRRAGEMQGTQVLADESQRLDEKEEMPSVFFRPGEGEVLRFFSWEPQYFEQLGIWQAHPGVDFSAEPGTAVYAMKDGTVRLEGGALSIDCPDGSAVCYRGLQSFSVENGQMIKAGALLGWAGAGVLFEGENHICVQLLQAGTWVDFSEVFSQ